MSVGDAERKERAERLRYLHGTLVQLLIAEGRFISERTNIFLVFNSLFFGGFVLLRTQTLQNPWNIGASILISGVGLIFTVFQFLIISENKSAADFWRNTIVKIENDADFWHEKTSGDTDLDFFAARQRLPAGKSKFLRVNYILGIWLPLVVGVVWIFTLAWSLRLEVS